MCCWGGGGGGEKGGVGSGERIGGKGSGSEMLSGKSTLNITEGSGNETIGRERRDDSYTLHKHSLYYTQAYPTCLSHLRSTIICVHKF